jgi:predicted phosphohydrolase
MRIVAAGDLHYGHYPQYDGQTEAMAEKICQEGGEVLILTGDIGCGKAGYFSKCLGLFKGFPGRKLLVPGNHDLWTTDGDSYELYERILPGIAASHGFAYLDHGPTLVDGTAFVGSMGWYDYSLKDSSLGIEERYYAIKMYPGLVRWNDARFIRWSFSDAEFTDLCLKRIAGHLEEAGEQAEKIVCVTHHLPFENMVDRKKARAWAFCNAFLGSSRIGDLLLRHRNVTHLLCGHSHNQGVFRNGSITCLKIGSSYRLKTYTSLVIK